MQSSSLTTGKKCQSCGKTYLITPSELELYKTMDVQEPVDCPECRRQRRLMFRNFFHLYHRTCDLSGKKIISMYDIDAPFPVYEMHEWWSDKWDALSFGMDRNDSVPFLKQVEVLHRTVPRMSIINAQCENTDYCNMSSRSRNCYLVFGCVDNEDCAYGHIVWSSKDCYDCLYCFRCEFCYECTDCVECNTVFFSRDCDNCSSSLFLVHCTGCSDCFGCVGLKNKRYHIFNQLYNKEEYQRKIGELDPGNRQTIDMARQRLSNLTGNEIVKSYHGFGCENVTGDYLYNSKNICEGYDLKQCEDCYHCATLGSFQNSADCNFSTAPSEFCYNCLTSYGHSLIACQTCMSPSHNLAYCDNCYNCKDCLGCVGLHSKQYCILNKQYGKEEYEQMYSHIKASMQQKGIWGQFFPYTFSPFCYNETIASMYFPLSENEVLARGWRWKSQEVASGEQYLGPVVHVSERIDAVADDVCQKILRCEVTGKLYKIIPQELAFYRRMNLPIPSRCFDQRHLDRLQKRNPRKLWDRTCAKCKKGIQTTYSPERPETVYCESCYLQTVY